MDEENQNVNPTSPEEKQTSTFNQVNSGEPISKKGNSRTSLIVIGILLIVAIIAGLVYYFTVYTKPSEMYKRLIGSTIDSYTDAMMDVDYKTSKTAFNLDANLETDQLDSEVLDLINKINLGIEAQADRENKQFIVNLDAKYDKEDLINMQVYSDVEEEKTYAKLGTFLDKYIEIEDMDMESYQAFKELLENQQMSTGEKAALKKAMNIIKKEMTSAIRDEYCSAEKEEITINGKKISATKNSIKMNMKQFKKEFTAIFENLRENEEFLNCFEEKEEMEDTLDELIDTADELDDDEDIMIEVAMYATGLTQNIDRAEIKVYEEDGEETVSLEITKVAEKTYEIEILENDNSLCKGKIEVQEKNKQEGTLKIEIEIEELGKLNLNIDYSQKYNEDIENINVENAVKPDKLTDTDQQQLMTNLQKSKLYELIESFSGKSSSSLIGSTTTSDKLKETDENDEEDNEISTNLKDNEILTYDNRNKITFGIPSGYKTERISENYQTLRKDDVSISVSSFAGDKDDYFDDIEDAKTYYEEESSYKDVELSQMQTMQVGSKTFYYATFSYQYADGFADKFEKMHVWSEISDDNVLTFEIDGAKDLSNEDLNKLLNINIEKN